MIAVVVLTHNRLHLLPRCVEDVLLRTSPETTEIVIWDNASDDGTSEYLAGLTEPGIRVVTNDENLGTSAYANAVKLTSAPYIVEVDDDVIEAPPEWDRILLEAFRAIPGIGHLAADLKEDPNDSAYCYLKYVKETRDVFARKTVGGWQILEGPTPGGCAMTSREVYEHVGGFRRNRKLVFWHETEAYVRDVRKLGYRTAILEDLKVWHAGSPYYSRTTPAKMAFYESRERVVARKDFVKRVILRLPFAAALNRRYRWFDPPHEYIPPDFGHAPDRP
jgi:GT2 family glycosyltransferase